MTAPEAAHALIAKLIATRLITTRDELESLPVGSIVIGEIEEYEGTYSLLRDTCCTVTGGWHGFDVFDYGNGVEIEATDDYTPQLPVLLVAAGERPDEDEGGDR